MSNAKKRKSALRGTYDEESGQVSFPFPAKIYTISNDPKGISHVLEKKIRGKKVLLTHFHSIFCSLQILYG